MTIYLHRQSISWFHSHCIIMSVYSLDPIAPDHILLPHFLTIPAFLVPLLSQLMDDPSYH